VARQEEVGVVTLLDLSEPDVVTSRVLSTREKFCIFHSANPQVFRELERMARAMLRRGRTKSSVKMCLEVLRWDYYMTHNDPNSDYKINNSYASFYSRLLMDTYPEFEGLFELRSAHD
jgi:hypothetical protein